MTYRLISFSCNCGTQGDYFTQIGVTDDYQLIVKWDCPTCQKEAWAMVSFETLVANAPKQKNLLSEADVAWLKSAHISMEADNERPN